MKESLAEIVFVPLVGVSVAEGDIDRTGDSVRELETEATFENDSVRDGVSDFCGETLSDGLSEGVTLLAERVRDLL